MQPVNDAIVSSLFWVIEEVSGKRKTIRDGLRQKRPAKREMITSSAVSGFNENDRDQCEPSERQIDRHHWKTDISEYRINYASRAGDEKMAQLL